MFVNKVTTIETQTVAAGFVMSKEKSKGKNGANCTAPSGSMPKQELLSEPRSYIKLLDNVSSS